MAAACVEFQNWRSLMKNFALSKYLKEANETGTSRQLTKDSDNLDLICILHSDLYIWSFSEGCVLHCSLKALATATGETESNALKAAGTSSFGDGHVSFQKLVPSDVFNSEIRSIKSNPCGTHLLLYGSRQVRVLELPRRWGKNAVFEGGKETITCRTTSICERALHRSSSLRILQASWHPGSKTNSHVAILTSDNRFWVYSVASSEQPLSCVTVSADDANSLEPASPAGRSLVGAVLGEVAVAFDFGLPITLQAKQQSGNPGGRTTIESSIEVWPVYCVRGSGAVMLVYSHISDIRSIPLPVQGPLTMLPPADDNYGVDACSILVLPTHIPVLVIATCEGHLHHCVQLPGTDDDCSQYQPNDSRSSISGLDGAWSNMYEPVPEPILYVIETAVLELCLALPQIEDVPDVEDEFMCPILLQKDGNSPDRYHCSHSAGVHTVALPWLGSVQQFFLEENQEDFGVSEDKACVVEHVLCTKPLYSCPTSPVLGLDVVTDPLLGATLLILDSEFEFTALPIGLQYQLTSPGTDSSLGGIGSGVDQQSREPFNKQVEQILHRKASMPLLKFPSGTEMTQKAMYQILTRAIVVLREEYIHKQDLARQEINTRMSILQRRKQHQQQDIETLLDSRAMLKENAAAISEKLERCKDDHEGLLRRLQNCLRKLQSRVPVLSEAEKQEMKELNTIKHNLDLYKQNIEQVRVKQEYQSRQMQRTGSVESPVLRQKQLVQIKDILQDEGSDIEELKNDISRLNLGIS